MPPQLRACHGGGSMTMKSVRAGDEFEGCTVVSGRRGPSEVFVGAHGAAMHVVADDLGVAERLRDVRVAEQPAHDLELHARAQPFGAARVPEAVKLPSPNA